MRKKEIIMSIHKNGEAKCDIATAEALATEGFINIWNYADGVLYGEIDYNKVVEEMICSREVEDLMEVFSDRWNKLNEAA